MIIDENDPNPETACTYADDAVGMTPLSEEWDEVFGEYPCIVDSNGEEVCKIDKNNFQTTTDGTSIDIFGTPIGDYMICFPRRGFRIKKNDNGTVTVSITNKNYDPDFKYYAFQRTPYLSLDRMYVGAFLSQKNTSSGIAISWLNHKVPSTFNSTTEAELMLLNKSNKSGVSFEVLSYRRLQYLQCLCLLKCKSLNVQTAFSYGYVNATSPQACGTTTDAGMNLEVWREKFPSYLTSGKHQTKILGLEDFWGNLFEIISNIKIDSNSNYNIIIDNYSGSYETITVSSNQTGPSSGYITNIYGDNDLGFLPLRCIGANNVYYCDFASMNANRNVMIYGDSFYSGFNAGLFAQQFVITVPTNNTIIGMRMTMINWTLPKPKPDDE